MPADPQTSIDEQSTVAWWDRSDSTASMATDATPESPTVQERALAVAAHLSALLNFFVPVLGAVIALLEIQTHAKASKFVKRHVQEALGFQIVYAVIFVGLAAVLVGQIYCIPLAPVCILWGLYCNAMAAKNAWRGNAYQYPLTTLVVDWWTKRTALV